MTRRCCGSFGEFCCSLKDISGYGEQQGRSDQLLLINSVRGAGVADICLGS